MRLLTMLRQSAGSRGQSSPYILRATHIPKRHINRPPAYKRRLFKGSVIGRRTSDVLIEVQHPVPGACAVLCVATIHGRPIFTVRNLGASSYCVPLRVPMRKISNQPPSVWAGAFTCHSCPRQSRSIRHYPSTDSFP